MASGNISALERLRKSSISVRDIAAQLWCEKQMELYILHGTPFTQAMAMGRQVHAKEQEKVFVKLPVEPVTWFDRLYKWAYENYNGIMNMQKKGYCREVRIYGSINGYKVSGQIDELRLDNNKVVVVEDKTISDIGSKNGVGQRVDSDKMQLSIYKKLIDDIKHGSYTYDNFARSYEIEGKTLSAQFIQGIRTLGIKDELLNLDGIYKKMFDAIAKMPEISEIVRLRYLDRSTNELITTMDMQYDRKNLDAYLSDAIKYWSGQRDARPVSEENKSRCMSCKFFGKQCTVWWRIPNQQSSAT